MKGEGVSLLLPPPAGPASPEAGCDSALYKGPTSHAHVPSGIPVSVLASAGTSSIRPSPPLLSTNLRSLSTRSKDLTIDLLFFFFSEGKKKKFYPRSSRAYLRKLVLLPGTRFNTLIQIAPQIDTKSQSKEKKEAERSQEPKEREAKIPALPSLASAIILLSPSAIFLENTSVCFS